jgi:beta-glucosidase
MTAYNMINGHHADMSIKNVQDILRYEWGFDGLVMSDWGGTNSTVNSLLAGLDLEMPGPPDQRGAKLVEAWSRAQPEEKREIENAIDVSVARVLDLAGNHGLLGLTPEAARATRDSPESSSTTLEDIKLMRRIAADGTVLLRNDCKTLPLAAERIRGKQIAFIGPNALQGIPGGGGSATMNPQYLSHPMSSFKSGGKELGIELSVKHSLGARGRKWLPLLQSAQWHARSSEPSSTSLLRLDYYSTLDLSGPILETQLRGSSLLDLSDTAPASLRTDPVPPYSYCITSALTPTTDGNHIFSICSIGEAILYVDNEVVVDNRHWKERGESFYTFGSVEAFGSKKMQANKEYTITIKTWTRVDPDEDVNVHFAAHPSIRIGFEEELGTREALCQEAIALANESEVSIVVLGLTDEWESEGYDRQFMGLPGDQDYLADSLLRRVKRPEDLVFVNQSGSPVELPWIHQAATFVQAFYGGQEAGNALADILLGVVNPSGHLPITWPKRYADLCFAHDVESWPGVDGKVYYKEGSQVGYRWYTSHTSVSPQWWFGYGDSYTTFDTKIRNAANTDESWQVTIRVENTGELAGSSVVQLYMWPKPCTYLASRLVVLPNRQNQDST